MYGAQDAKIVLCVLKIVFGLHPIAARCGVARKREIFVVNLLGCAADADVRAVRIKRAIGIDALPAPLMIAPALVEMIIHVCRFLTRY